jgi:hypothetical protein
VDLPFAKKQGSSVMKQASGTARSERVRSGLAPFLTIAAWKITAANAATLRRCGLALLSLALLSPSAAMANVQALFNPDVVKQAPFPSDRFTVPNPANITRLQVSLPLPDCTTHPSDCNDLRVVNTLDGFSVNPRVSIPFSGPIDVNSVNSHTIFFVELENQDRIVGINRIVWDPATNTLHAQSDQLLKQHTPYALVVTDGVHDAAGNLVQPSAGFARLLGGDFDTSQAYLADLSQALDNLSNGGNIVVASVFTTQSVSAILEKIRHQIAAATPAPASFLLGPGGLPAYRHNKLYGKRRDRHRAFLYHDQFPFPRGAQSDSQRGGKARVWQILFPRLRGPPRRVHPSGRYTHRRPDRAAD